VSPLSLRAAVARIAEGGLVAYPTETVWGLGADASCDPAVAALRRLKGRGDDAPISVLVAALGSLAGQGFEPGPAGRALADRFWPGPLTLVMRCRRRLAPGIARADGAVGVRCSPHPTAAGLARGLERAGIGPLTATSLNRSGEPPARTRAEAAAVFAERADAPALVGDEDAGGEAPSTVVDVCGERPQVLRWGGLAESRLAPLLEEIAAA
jgi:L-threonylcarbamoyladenylate synthase